MTTTHYSGRNLPITGSEAWTETCRCGSTLGVHGYSDALAARCAFIEAASSHGWDALPISEDSSVVRWTCPLCIKKLRAS